MFKEIVDTKVWYRQDYLPVADAFARASAEGVRVLDFHDGCSLGDSALRPLDTEDDIRLWVKLKNDTTRFTGIELDGFFIPGQGKWEARSASAMAQKLGLE